MNTSTVNDFVKNKIRVYFFGDYSSLSLSLHRDSFLARVPFHLQSPAKVHKVNIVLTPKNIKVYGKSRLLAPWFER